MILDWNVNMYCTSIMGDDGQNFLHEYHVSFFCPSWRHGPYPISYVASSALSNGNRNSRRKKSVPAGIITYGTYRIIYYEGKRSVRCLFENLRRWRRCSSGFTINVHTYHVYLVWMVSIWYIIEYERLLRKPCTSNTFLYRDGDDGILPETDVQSVDERRC